MTVEKEKYIFVNSFETQTQELAWIAEKILDLKEGGTDFKEMAVIAPKHKYLKEVVRIFNFFNIPIYYEKGNEVLSQPHIHQLLTILKFIHSLNKKDVSADELLPEILSYPFWKIKPLDIWKISLITYRGNEQVRPLSWMEVMQNIEKYEGFENPEIIKNLANFFLTLAVEAEYEPVEKIIDKTLGIKESDFVPESTDEEVEEKEESEENFFTSPFKDYYFNPKKITENSHLKSEYLIMLSGLKVLIEAIRNYKPKETLVLDDFINYIELREKNELDLIDNSPFNSEDSGVNLLTAYKAKGLEFENVFVINCQQEVWFNPRGKNSKISFLNNLPLSPTKDEKDDKLRLFYVALTRAKEKLFLTYNEISENNKDKKNSKIEFLEELENYENIEAKKLEDEEGRIKSLEVWLNTKNPLNFDKMQVDFAKALLKDYQMPVTHLINFLDLSRGEDSGPKRFLEQNLLHFPQSKIPSGSYGSAMHASLENFYNEFKNKKVLPTKEFLINKFQTALKFERMSPKDFEDYLRIGKENLEFYYEQNKENFDINSKPELNFRNQGVTVGEAKITGKIDLINFLEEGKIEVVDFKTGKPITSWGKGQDYEKVKSWKYEIQLVFYKLLIEGSREYSQKKVETGKIIFLDSKTKKFSETVILDKKIEPQETEKLKKLIQAVHSKIMNLDFPSIDKYSKDQKGTEKFIEDLVEGRI